MDLAPRNEYLVNIVYTDGQGIRSHIAEYAAMYFQLFMG